MSSTGAAPIVVTPHLETPAEPADFVKLREEFEKVAASSIGRWVAAGVALAVPVITAFCAWLQKEVGINLDPASLTAFITSMAAGLSIMGFKWLSNRGDWEKAAVEGYQIYLTGHAATAPASQVVIAPSSQLAAPAPAAPAPVAPAPVAPEA
ncbi:MAG TPA: hypothetical protein VGY13_14180 [Solirubrobacteraceae bacterium]|jgi:hypothetical protein|nr:hypothetical protein [Solirubrobacteraceae bacterium]